MKPTIFTWILAIFGAITFLPLIAAQFGMLLKPDSRQVKDLIIGKGKEWRELTHFRSALAFAWADILIILPLLVSGTLGVLSGQLWGYVLWLALGIHSIYFSIVFWVLRKPMPIRFVAGWFITHTSGDFFFTGALAL